MMMIIRLDAMAAFAGVDANFAEIRPMKTRQNSGKGSINGAGRTIKCTQELKDK
jgi:hypothetical protein